MVDLNKINDMCEWEQSKAFFLIQVARNLGMDTSGHGEVAVNTSSGYTYIWLEDYNFSLYMPISCDLDSDNVYALWTDSNDGSEHEVVLGMQSLQDLEMWSADLEKNMECGNNESN